MGSEIEGWFANDDFTIGDAVAASSCFPPVFSPMILKLPQPVGKGSPGPLLIKRACTGRTAKRMLATDMWTPGVLSPPARLVSA